MGCDIHIFVEKRDDQGKWNVVEGPNSLITDFYGYAQFHKENGHPEKAEKYLKDAEDIASGKKAEEYSAKGYNSTYNPYKPMVIEDWIYSNRNYILFSVLADVRNRHGIKPISPSKGVPDDASPEVKDKAKDWDWDGHNYSYLSLKELEDYDWNQSVTITGVVSVEEYKAFKETGSPTSYSGGAFGQAVINLSNEEMDDLIAGNIVAEQGKYYYTTVSWQEVIKEMTSDFYENSILRLKQLAAEDPESVRIVFWFDN